MVYILRNRINGNLYSINNNHVQTQRPALIAFKNKQDATMMSHTIKNIDDIFKESLVEKRNGILGLPSVHGFITSQFKKDKNISIDNVSLANLIRRCTMNCLDIMLIEDTSGTHTMYHLNVMDTEEYVFHLDNVMKYW